MTTRRELEALPSEELADRALALARHRLDLGFFWELVRTVPEAEAAMGDVDHGKADVMWFSALLNDLGKADEGRLAEALRPLYLDYLERHTRGDESAADHPGSDEAGSVRIDEAGGTTSGPAG